MGVTGDTHRLKKKTVSVSPVGSDSLRLQRVKSINEIHLSGSWSNNLLTENTANT